MATSVYELVLMLDPRGGDEQREKLATDTKARIEAGGTLEGESPWGLRKMAYEIAGTREADYRCFRFSGGREVLDDLNHTLRITDGVLRFRIFEVDAETPQIVPPDTEQIMRRDDDDDRGRGGRGRRDDRSPRRPREERPAAEGDDAAEATATGADGDS